MSIFDNLFGQNEQAPMAPLSTAVSQQGAAGVAPVSGLAGQLIQNNINPVTGAPMTPGFFQQGGGAQLALGAVQTIGNLWNSFQQNKMARKSLALQETAYNNNLADQRGSYNTALEDRIRARYATEGRSEQANSYIEANRL